MTCLLLEKEAPRSKVPRDPSALHPGGPCAAAVTMGQHMQPANAHTALRRLTGWWAALPFLCVGASLSAGAATFTPIDLSAPCAAAFSNAPSPQSWLALPRGTQTLDGVVFKIDGKLEVTGLDDARNGELHPSRLTGLRVGRKCARLWLLHGADGLEGDGVPIAKLLLHYANGKVRDVRLGYGVHVVSWFKDRREKTNELADVNSKLAWTGVSDEPDHRGTPVRLFKTGLDNPLPDQEIASLELVSLYSRATPFLVAVTAEDEPAPSHTLGGSHHLLRKLNAFSDSAYRREFLIHATDAADGATLAGAKASLTIADDQSAFFFGDATADSSGDLRVPYPPQHAVWFSLLVRAPGHVSVTLSGSKTNSGAEFPGELSARLERGVLIGGRVNDSAGQPLPGAQVLVFKVEKTGPREYTRMDYGTVTTGRDGKWSSSLLPSNFTGFGFEISHPEYRPATYAQEPGAWA